MKHRIWSAVAFALACGLAGAASAQEPIVLRDVIELSGPGATVGTNWRNGIDMAIEEINAEGGILGHPIEISHADSQTNPGIARAQVQRALDDNPYVLLGPGYSGSVKVTMGLAEEAGVPNFVAGEAAELTQMGNKYLFRTSFGQQMSMPKIIRYIAEDLAAKRVAVVWVNNDFGKGGRDAAEAELKARNIEVVADVSTEVAQGDFAADVQRIKESNADVVFIYLNEEESARLLIELRKQNVDAKMVGETTLLSQKVIELAGAAANGVLGHVGLTTDAPVPAITAFRDKFFAKYNYVPDHNGLKGYIVIYIIKAVTEAMGAVDRAKFADTLHGMLIKASENPGVLMDVQYDANGDLDRESFLAEIVDGKQTIPTVLPMLSATQ